jgi:hypothetical protein
VFPPRRPKHPEADSERFGQVVAISHGDLHELDARPTLQCVGGGMAGDLDRRHPATWTVATSLIWPFEQPRDGGAERPGCELHLPELVDEDYAALGR